MEGKKLKFAILCEHRKINQWQLKAVSELTKQKVADLCGVIHYPGTSKSTLSKQVPLSRITNDHTIWIDLNECISEADLRRIQSMELDFILNFRKGKIETEFLQVPRYGVWEFDIGDGWKSICRNIYFEKAITSAFFRKIEPDHQFLILKQGHFSTIMNSVWQTRKLVLEASASWPLQVCRDILQENSEYLYRDACVGKDFFEERQYKLNPFLLLVKLIRNKTAKLYTKLFRYEYWNVGIVHKPISSLLTEDDKFDIQWLVARKDMYLADPFVYKKGGNLRIIMEELNHKVVKGFISEVAILEPEAGEASIKFYPATLRSSTHLSYPFIVEYEGESYCIPETSEENEVAIYKLHKETGEWNKLRTIIKDFPGVDSTIVKNGDYWWLFCTKAYSTKQSHNNELYIFYSLDLMGDWKPHMLNPVKVDITSSRPAGTPFLYKGELYRPSQDCSETYGGRISLNKIKVLSPNQFEEITIKQILPDESSLYPDGIHTVSDAGGMMIIDGKRFDDHIMHFFRKLYKFRPKRLEQVKVKMRWSDGFYKVFKNSQE